MNGSLIPDTYKLVLLAGNGMPAIKKRNDNHTTLQNLQRPYCFPNLLSGVFLEVKGNREGDFYQQIL